MVGIFARFISIAAMESVLAIETSVPQASIALWGGDQWLYDKTFTSDRNHNSMLFEPLADALGCLQGKPLSAIVVGTGPGSYSGTRIGIAAAQGVAIARNCMVAGLGSLAATPVARTRAPAMAVGDARRGLYFICPITSTGEAAQPELMDEQGLRNRLEKEPQCNLFTLDDPEKLASACPQGQPLIPTTPEARLLVEVWLGLDHARRMELQAMPLAPSYLRAPFTSRAKPGHPLIRTEK